MTTDKKRGVQLPWGLSADNLTPGSMKVSSIYNFQSKKFNIMLIFVSK